jgi:hypothetical protein
VRVQRTRSKPLLLAAPDPLAFGAKADIGRASATDRSRESIFTSIAQAIDSGLQASLELSPFTLGTRTLLPKVGTAIFAKSANLSELSKHHQAWK